MKKTIYKYSAVAAMVFMSFGIFAQTPPHPNGGSGPGTGNTPVGGGAPIDGGLTLMIVLGAAYGSKKLYRKENTNN